MFKYNKKSKKNKYNAKKTCGYDSKSEYDYSLVLKDRLKDGEISDLQEQVRYDFTHNGKYICFYKADFQYLENGQLIVVDVKSKATQKLSTYRLKKKMMKVFHGIDIKEVF